MLAQIHVKASQAPLNAREKSEPLSVTNAGAVSLKGPCTTADATRRSNP
jgi:hypothetical protein